MLDKQLDYSFQRSQQAKRTFLTVCIVEGINNLYMFRGLSPQQMVMETVISSISWRIKNVILIPIHAAHVYAIQFSKKCTSLDVAKLKTLMLFAIIEGGGKKRQFQMTLLKNIKFCWYEL